MSNRNFQTIAQCLIVSGFTNLSIFSPLSAQALTINLTHYSDSETSLLPQIGIYNTSTLPAGQVVQPGTPGQSFQFSGAALFKSTYDRLQSTDPNVFNLNLNAGDLILPGPQLSASLDQFKQGKPFYETTLLKATQPDAIILGNHDFDLGSQIAKDFLVDPATNKPVAPLVNTNLIPNSNDPLYGLIQASTVVTKNVGGVDQKIGIIGLNTPSLPQIASPGPNIEVLGGNVNGDPTNPGFRTLVDLVKAEVIKLNSQGVKDIVFASHLQTIDNEEALLKALGNPDPATQANPLPAVQVAVVIAGGNHLTQANLTDSVQPLASTDIRRTPYPIIYDDTTGKEVSSLSQVTPGGHSTLFVTSAPDATYIGNIKFELDSNGNVTSVLSGTQNVPVNNLPYTDANGIMHPGLTPDQTIKATIEVPVAAAVDTLKNTPVASTEVRLSSLRNEVRSGSTNLGSLIADSMRQAAINQTKLAGGDASKILVGIQNGGGIRNDLTFQPGATLSQFDTYEILPFGSLVSVVKDITGNELKEILERAVSGQQCVANCDPADPNHVSGGGGQFLQISGVDFTYDPTAQQQVVNNGVITNAGNRILRIVLDPKNNGQNTTILYDYLQGGFQNGSATKALFDLAVSNFTANGGDTFVTLQNIPDTRKVTFGQTDQQGWNDYLTNANYLNGNVTAAGIPNAQTRITAALTTAVPEPSNLVGVAVGIVGFLKLALRKRR